MNWPLSRLCNKHPYEDDAMRIVQAIKDDIAPSMDSNDGGEIVYAILMLVNKALSDHAATHGLTPPD